MYVSKLFKKAKIQNVYTKFLSEELKNIGLENIPKNYQEIAKNRILISEQLKSGKVRYNDKILHQSKIMKFYIENEGDRKVQKEIDKIFKKISKNRKYFYSAKDLALVDALLKDGFKIAAEYATQNEVFVGIDQDEMVYIKNDSTPIQSLLKFQLEYFRRTGFYQTQFFNARFVQLKGWDILSPRSENYFGNENSSLQFLNLSYRYKFDKRFSQNYPLNGYFFDFQIDQFGLGTLDQSNIFVTRLLSSYRKYWKINHLYFFAAGAYLNHYFNEKTPFYLQGGLGFSNYVRGYEPYIIYGKTSGLLKTNFKTKLVKTKPFTIPVIKKIKKFSKMHFALYWNCYLV